MIVLNEKTPNFSGTFVTFIKKELVLEGKKEFKLGILFEDGQELILMNTLLLGLVKDAVSDGMIKGGCELTFEYTGKKESKNGREYTTYKLYINGVFYPGKMVQLSTEDFLNEF